MTFNLRPSTSRLASAAVVLALILLVWRPRALRSDNFIFYSPQGHEVVPIQIVDHEQYLPLIQVLNAVGSVSGWQEKRKSLVVYFGSVHVEVHVDNATVKVDRTQVALPAPVRISNGQWMVPLSFVDVVLPKIVQQRLTYRVGSERMFIGDVYPALFTVSLKSLPGGSRLSIEFTSAVKLKTASRNGKYVLFLGNHPVEPLEKSFHFQDPYVTDLAFDDQDGEPKFIVTPGSAALNFYPSEASGGKTLLVDLAKAGTPLPLQGTTTSAQSSAPPPSAPAAPAPSPAVVGSKSTNVATANPAAAPAEPMLPAVVLDAGHGAQDAGARSRDGVLEKDLAAQIEDRVRGALIASHSYRVVLTRVGDTNPDLDARDAIANATRPIAFLSLHAGNYGASVTRIVVYTYRFPSPTLLPVEPSRPAFVPWDEVQRAHLDRSRELAQALETQFANLPGITAFPAQEAPVHVLRDVDAPAVALEVGSLSPDDDAGLLTDPGFQERLSTAIAQAITIFGRGPAKP
ncbi:MAG TPA: N-acetylmuramoyl-L-alanine amidase [Terriglobia bacterium]|nr:N-acetylmuramoyl-L-alanine amidase [Terriglobia bacterium]